MKLALKYFTLIFVFFIGSSFTTSEMAWGKWKKLGSKQVANKLDRDVIHVGLKKGGFTKLKVQVTRGGINMHKMIVEYANGSQDKIELKQTFKKNYNTRIIDLEGGKRVIKNITFWYDSKNISRKKAVVHVYGKK